MKLLDFWVNFLANLLTIVASSVAIYIFFFKRDSIKSVLNFIISYSYQLTLSDLRHKLERLNDFNASDPQQKVEVINIVHDIEGQILGNSGLKDKLGDQLEKISQFTTSPKLLTEPRKRSLVSELREAVRSIDASNFGTSIQAKTTQSEHQ